MRQEIRQKLEHAEMLLTEAMELAYDTEDPIKNKIMPICVKLAELTFNEFYED